MRRGASGPSRLDIGRVNHPGRQRGAGLDEPAACNGTVDAGWYIPGGLPLAGKGLRPEDQPALLVGARAAPSSRRPARRPRMDGGFPRLRSRSGAYIRRRVGRVAAGRGQGAVAGPHGAVTAGRCAGSGLACADRHRKGLAVTPQAGLGLLRQLREAGIIREATGRPPGGPSWSHEFMKP